MTLVLGVDGCPGGWCVVELDAETYAVSQPVVEASFKNILARPAEIICVDIPIGLLCGKRRRECDVQARERLAQRRSCVFDPPCRHALGHTDHRSASDANQRCTSRGLSIQAFYICDKIARVDDAITGESGQRVFEVHPELCFLGLNSGVPVLSRKKRLNGRAERWALLRGVLPGLPAEAPKASQLHGRCEPDDLIDALAAAWTAVCITRGKAVRIPDQAETDEKGLRMEMSMPRNKRIA